MGKPKTMRDRRWETSIFNRLRAPIHVINLRNRPEKRRTVEAELDRRGILKYKVFTAIPHPTSPKRGCLESHLHLIRQAIAQHLPAITILEDDILFTHTPLLLENPPSNWDMLYLGGTVHRVMDTAGQPWRRVQTWTTHGYIINLQNPQLVAKLLQLESYQEEIDKFYLQEIHPFFHAYMCDPMVAIQRPGYSDIEGRTVDYSFMQNTLNGLMTPEHSIEGGTYRLILPDIPDDQLPAISIVTPTYKRRKLFAMAIRNWQHFHYPRDKMEWVIVDDTPEQDPDSIIDLIPHDPHIHYVQVPAKEGGGPHTIAYKRNVGADVAKNPIIVHMDDDDYYPEDSVLCRVKLLMKYHAQGIRCVGCTKIGVYDLIHDTSTMTMDSPISFSEASMAYFRDFWRQQPYRNETQRGEHKDIMEGRLGQCMEVPYAFVIIAINHRGNATGDLRKTRNQLQRSDGSGTANYFDQWDADTQTFVNDLRNYILRSS